MSVQDFPRSAAAQRLRDQADDMQERAAGALSPEVRLTYLELARSWQKAARRVEVSDDRADDDRPGPATLTQ
jgi:hypothetical protein